MHRRSLGGEFQQLALRYVQMQLTQATQSAACNAKHDISQRLARWLLLCADRAERRSSRCRRTFLPSCSGYDVPPFWVGMVRLKRKGMLEYVRDRIRLLDVDALEREHASAMRF